MLIYHKDPNGLTEKEIYQLDTSLSLLQNIRNKFPSGFDNNTTDVYLNNEKINPLEYDLSRNATIFDKIVIINRQQASVVVSIIVAIVAAVVAYALAPTPKTPNASGEQKDSTNNKLTEQTNIARLYQAKPDIYGCIRSYPDIVNPAVSEYIGNVKYIDHLFCIGVGYYDLNNLKYDQTLLNRISGTTYKIYQPGDIIPYIRYQFRSAEVNGQELKPPNLANEVLHLEEHFNLSSCTIKDGIATFALKAGDTSKYFNDLNKPLRINFTINAGVRYPSGDIYIHNVLYTAVLESTYIEDNLFIIKCSRTVKVRVDGLKNIVNGHKYEIIPMTSYLKLEHIGGVYTDAFIPPEEGVEIWADLVFQRGLQGYVNLDFIWWAIDDFGNEIAGTRETMPWNCSMSTYEPQNITVKIKPRNGKSKYALMIARVTNGKGDLSDQVKVENVSIIDYEYNYKVKDTLIYVRTRATSQATALKELKFNVEATRKTITYNYDTKEIDYNIRPSRSFADAVLHQFVSVFGRDPRQLDLDSLYQIDRRIKNLNERLGYFDFSFDDIDVSLGQRIETICNAARVYVYRDGQKWRFARNEEKTRPVALFNALNTVNSSEGGVVQKKSNLPSTHDGVQVEYVDSSKDRAGGTDKKSYINLRISNNQIVKGFARTPNKIELAGCRNYEQAMDRAQLEIRRLIYERTFVEDEVLNDANFVEKGDLVLWSDTYDESIVSGEIVRIQGNKFYVDQELSLDSNKSYRVAITDKCGYPSSWINIKSHDEHSFTADYSSAYVANNNNIQMGSLFIIAETINEEPTEFILTKKQFNNGAYKVSLTNYDSRIYEYDRENGYFAS